MKLKIISHDTIHSMLQKFLYNIKVYFETLSNFVDWNMLEFFSQLSVDFSFDNMVFDNNKTTKTQENILNLYIITVSKIRENIYGSLTFVTFELYGHLGCLQVLYSKWNYSY